MAEFKDLLKTADWKAEKHVPVIDVEESGVRVTVGKEIPHPNTVEHHIAWLQLFGEKAGGQVVDLGVAALVPSYTAPDALFRLDVAGFKAFHALSYCNLHGVWTSSHQM